MSEKPVKRFRIGFVEAAIWKNTKDDRTFHSVKLSRSYKDGDEYQSTDSFSQADLLNASKVLERAEVWISNQ